MVRHKVHELTMDSGKYPAFWMRIIFQYGVLLALVIAGIVIMSRMEVVLPLYLTGTMVMCAVVVTLMGAWFLLPEKIHIRSDGIEVTRVFLKKKAAWTNFTGVRSKIILVSAGKRFYPRPAIEIRTKEWNHTVADWRYPSGEIQTLFKTLVTEAVYRGAEIEDELGWLPSKFKVSANQDQIKLKQYKMLTYAGLVTCLGGAVCGLLFFVHLLFLVLAISGLFIGLMCLVGGLTGYASERKKAKLEENDLGYL